MGPNPFIGVLYHWVGGFAPAISFIPFRRTKRWSWEIYWRFQGVAVWIVAPVVLASIFVLNLFGILCSTTSSSLGYAFFFGALWGIGGLTFGLAIRYLSIALGYANALGLSIPFGTLIPPIYRGQMKAILHETWGASFLLKSRLPDCSRSERRWRAFQRTRDQPGREDRSGRKRLLVRQG